MSVSEYTLGWRQFRAMPLYLQFILALMVTYATAMTVLSAVVALDSVVQAAVLFSIAALVWVFALLIIPSRIGSKYDPGS